MENNTSLQQQLLEAGVHFGHLRKKWNPKMLPYIFAEKKGIHIIDLNKTTADCTQWKEDPFCRYKETGERHRN